MTTTLALIAFACSLGLLGPRLLDRWAWPHRSPAMGILAWQALTISVFGSFVWAGVTLAAHAVPERGWLGSVVHACSVLLPEVGGWKEGSLLPVAGAVASGACLAALLATVHWIGRRQRAQASRHEQMLHLVGRTHAEPDVLIIEHDTPTVFCLPCRRRGTVIMSQGALDLLTDLQVQQVLAHERAHLASRHHLVLRWADAFAMVMGGWLGSRLARTRIAELIEMHADDAAGPSDRRSLAVALVTLAGGVRPLGALGAGTSALSRVRRLTSPVSPVPRRMRAGITAGLVVLILIPSLIATTPGLAELLIEECPFLF